MSVLYSQQDFTNCTPKPSLLSESYEYVLALSIYSNFMVHALMDKERALVGFEPIQHHTHNFDQEILVSSWSKLGQLTMHFLANI